MNDEGAREWMILTRNNIHRSIAIIEDGKVYSFPTVQGEIAGGHSSITGNFSLAEAEDMANVLLSKELPCPVKVIDMRINRPPKGPININ